MLRTLQDSNKFTHTVVSATQPFLPRGSRTLKDRFQGVRELEWKTN